MRVILLLLVVVAVVLTGTMVASGQTPAPEVEGQAGVPGPEMVDMSWWVPTGLLILAIVVLVVSWRIFFYNKD